MTETCSNCRFGFSEPWTMETGEKGVNVFCRAAPPMFVPPNGSTLIPVRPEGWCGKWQTGAIATKSVPAPRSDPNPVSFSKPSVPNKKKMKPFSMT